MNGGIWIAAGIVLIICGAALAAAGILLPRLNRMYSASRRRERKN